MTTIVNMNEKMVASVENVPLFGAKKYIKAQIEAYTHRKVIIQQVKKQSEMRKNISTVQFCWN